MSQPKHLFQLQQIDTNIDNTRARLAEIETALNDNSTLQKAKALAEKAEKAYQQSQIALKHAEQDVETQQGKIDNNERALYGGAITNPKELEDLQLESGALKRHLSTLEDRQLEAMVAFEEAEAKHQQAQANLSECKEQVAKDNVDLTSEQGELLAFLDQLNAQRQEAAAPVSSEAMDLYQDLRQSKAGMAVAEVLDNSCTACGANLTAAQAQAARLLSKITTCDSCKRIIYAK